MAGRRPSHRDDALLKLGAGPIPIGEGVELLDIPGDGRFALRPTFSNHDCSERCSSASGPEGKVSAGPMVRTQGSLLLTATTTAIRSALAVSALAPGLSFLILFMRSSIGR